MDWSNKSWRDEDERFFPKRKISNKGSDKNPHMIGGAPSRKTVKNSAPYNSLNECWFTYLLELDPLVKRFYVQPVEVPIPYIDEYGYRKTWPHTPDVLFFRQGLDPFLCQVKEGPAELSDKDKRCIKHSEMFASELGWKFAVVYPKQMPQIVLRNLKFLIGCTKVRLGYPDLIPKIEARLIRFERARICDLAKSLQYEANSLLIEKVIYHLISVGIFTIDLKQPLTAESMVYMRSPVSGFLEYVCKEGVLKVEV